MVVQIPSPSLNALLHLQAYMFGRLQEHSSNRMFRFRNYGGLDGVSHHYGGGLDGDGTINSKAE